MVDKRLLPEHDIDKRQYAVTPVFPPPGSTADGQASARKRMEQGRDRHAG